MPSNSHHISQTDRPTSLSPHQAEPPLRTPWGWLTELSFSCARVCSCWSAAFSSTSPPVAGEGKKHPFQAGAECQCRREKVRRRRGGWGCEWEGELEEGEGGSSMRPAYLVLLPAAFPRISLHHRGPRHNFILSCFHLFCSLCVETYLICPGSQSLPSQPDSA